SVGTPPILPSTDCEQPGVVEEHGASMADHPVFISYARKTSTAPAEARHRKAAEVPRRNFRRVARRESRRGLRRRNVLHAMVLPARIRPRADSVPETRA